MEAIWLAVAQQLGKMDAGHFVLMVVIGLMAYFIFTQAKEQSKMRSEDRMDRAAAIVAMGQVAEGLGKIREAIAANSGRTMQ